MDAPSTLPIVDVAALLGTGSRAERAAADIARACREFGFFYAIGHGVPAELLERLEDCSRRFFALDEATKLEVAMARSGKAWRAFFPVGAELTSGRPDQKEGLYFGAELPADHERVVAGLALHGPNQFPNVPGLREAVLEYIEVMTTVGHALMRGLALSLELDATYFDRHYTSDPFCLFRIFHYPPLTADVERDVWSVAEHTDYGLLTMLHQDGQGGLEVRVGSRWIAAPPVPGSLVCNLGDMLERMTRGLYLSTPHRVRNEGSVGRLSFPFFFDPGFDVEVHPIRPGERIVQESPKRWDGASVHDFRGTYGEYLLEKVGKVFPDLGRSVL